MGKINRHSPRVKLIIGFIYKDEAFFIKSRDMLKRRFGKTDFESKAIDFSCTGYYEKEMGSGLKKKFISFSRRIPIQELPRIKLYTNKVESRFLDSGRRMVNIDPGYLDMAKLVLASTKDYAHRIYLGKGIFAEITLSYRGNSFAPNDWTYPDYRSPEYLNIFNAVRRLYVP